MSTTAQSPRRRSLSLRSGRKIAVLAAVAAVLAGLVAVLTQTAAEAHGALQAPASRTYACYTDGLTGGQIIPKNPACADAVAAGGTQPLYDWYGVLRSDGGGRTRGFIPDGQLCSGGFSKYSAYDAPRTDWPTTTLKANSMYDFVYGAWVPHPGGFKLYVTKDGWDPTKPLTWDDMEEQPFLTVDPEPEVSNGAYRFSGRLPDKSGRHIIYAVWYRSDSQETFYGCSDVNFLRDGASPSPSPSASPSASPTGNPSPSPSPSTSPTAGNPACTATVKLTNTWPGGFQGEATITNTGTAPLNGWYMQWQMSNGATITQAWNGTSMQSGPFAMIHAPEWNNSLAPGASATAGFLGSGSATPAISDISCG
ncbi:lytic polysaccharide monooxygenase [Microbispora hainanensis]|uniref:Lytic polysaccharide monooxygenase n=1 Tax=Microbispora hainanensis TaxID=568844 RepID=A0ABZ1SXG5_9ACTN|nr:lytic polysaccharide monooxygenase [Microbispora hainanensis]